MASEEEVSNEFSGLDCQRLQSKGTQHKNSYQCSSGQKKYGCIHCLLEYGRASTLRRHQRKKHPREFAAYKRQLMAIRKIHQFPCHKCDRIFNKKYKLNRHVKNVHGILRACPDCHKLFASKRSLKHHRELEHSEKQKAHREIRKLILLFFWR